MPKKSPSFKIAYERFIHASKKQRDTRGITRQEILKWKTKSGLEIHHIVPKSLGGTDKLTNLVLLSHEGHIYAHLLLNLALLQEGKREWLAKLDYGTISSKLLMKLLKTRKSAFRGLKLNMFIAGKQHPPTTLSITDTAKILCAVARQDFNDQAALSKMAAEALNTAIFSGSKLGYKLEICF